MLCTTVSISQSHRESSEPPSGRNRHAVGWQGVVPARTEKMATRLTEVRQPLHRAPARRREAEKAELRAPSRAPCLLRTRPRYTTQGTLAWVLLYV